MHGPACSMLQLDRTKSHTCSAAKLVPFAASLNGTANNPTRRKRPQPFDKCEFPSFRTSRWQNLSYSLVWESDYSLNPCDMLSHFLSLFDRPPLQA